MSRRQSETYYASIVQVIGSNNVVVGAGVLIDQRTIITCLHVVSDALGIPRSTGLSQPPIHATVFVRRIFIDGEYAIPRNARLISCTNGDNNSGTADIAILQVVDGLYDTNGDKAIMKFGVIEEANNQALKIAGFPIDGMGPLNPYASANYILQEILYSGWLMASMEEGGSQEIRPGFSGAPVLDKSSGLIIGIICEADTVRRYTTIIPTHKLALIHPLSIEAVAAEQLVESHEMEYLQLTKPGLRILLDRLFPRLHFLCTIHLNKRFFKDPPERAVLQEYLHEQQSIWKNDIDDKTYLPPPVGDLHKQPVPTSYSKNRLVLKYRINELVSFSSGGDAATAQISAHSLKTKRVTNLLRRLRRTRKPIVLLGEPGSGKTLTLKQTAINICKRNAHRVFPTICIFIPLGRWKPHEKPDLKDVEELVYQQVPASIRPLMRSLIDQRRVILMLDGMDEISREKYNEHIEALSLFAGKMENRIGTLFSCRIADFSPEFKHHRMVLKLFGRQKLSTYLRLQLKASRITVGRKILSISQITNRLLDGDLPIEPRNPFSLWLLSLYLREVKAWPDSKVELLKFFYTFQYERKAEEAKRLDKEFPPEEKLLLQWGRLAFEITRQNKGSDIDPYLTRALFGDETAIVLKTGMLCSVLQPADDDSIECVRFVHHRAQEYFTAYYVVNARPLINWSAILDIPRWQEILILISQMNPDLAPFYDLQQSLDSINADNFSRSGKTTAHAEWEMLTADRIEFAARIAAVIPRSVSSSPFLTSLEIAAKTMAQHGGPNAQVKMLRVAQLLPTKINLSEAVAKAAASKNGWVQDNARLVAATLAGTPTSTKIPEELISSFADGSILTTIRARVRLAKKIKSPRTLLVTLLVAIVFLVEVVAMAGILPVLSKYLTQLAIGHVEAKRQLIVHASADLSISKFYSYWNHWVIGGITFLLFIWSIIVHPNKSRWIPVIGSGAIVLLSLGTYYLLMLMPATSIRMTIVVVIASVALLYTCFLLFSAVAFIVGMIVQVLSVDLIMLIITRWTGKRKYDCTSYQQSWPHNGGRAVFSNIKLVFAVLGVLLLVVWSNILLIVVGFLLPLSILWAVFCNIVRCFSAGVRKKDWREIAFRTLYGLISNVLMMASGWLVIYLFCLFSGWKESGIVSVLFFVVCSATAIVLLCLFFPLCRQLYFWVNNALRVRTPANISDFRKGMSQGNPSIQISLIENTSHNDLGLDILSYHRLLINMETYIRHDKVKSKYYSKRAEVWEILRQSRYE